MAIADLFLTFATKYPEARCISHADEMFPLNDSNGEAKAYCTHCPHKLPCLLEAIATDSFGIWGETTRNERLQIIRAVDDSRDSK